MVLRHTGTIPVPFRGARAGTHPLTWGQKDIYRAWSHQTPHAAFFNVRTMLPVPAGTTLSQVRAAVRWLVEEYESLRTTCPTRPAGGLYQRVRREGVLPLAVVAADGWNGDPDAPFPGFGTEFRPADDFPLRVAVVTANDAPAWVVLELSHLSVDLTGARLVRRALTGRLSGVRDQAPVERPPVERSPVERYQPADRAADEATPAAAALHRRAVGYLRGVLDPAMVPTFGAADLGSAPSGPRPRTRMRSPALGAAVGVLAARHAVTAAQVYLGLLAVVVGTLSGRTACVLNTVASNRWISRGVDYVGTLNQYAPMAVDLADADLPTVLRRAQVASLDAFSNALYDMDDLVDGGLATLLDQVDCVVNNVHRSAPAAPVPPDGIPALRAHTDVTEAPLLGSAPPHVRRAVHLSVAGTGAAPELLLSVDPRLVGATNPADVLAAVEAAAVAEATRPPEGGRPALALMEKALGSRTPAR
ncbi:condensation domain-containing protein [Virgisporangium aurantiacum]|uniref:Condensation domain-containing protein n=1 Tax=Virgisporangium aurantiacum TaxID=175570 RepID=A0A8J3ZG23_9ACTN|nr:condensation domain-containing protein [Virgisporangium aurantiacum]GIJ62227.1 hypothetical protein Vau01_097430 [Virgisporangium aurantiacum]